MELTLTLFLLHVFFTNFESISSSATTITHGPETKLRDCLCYDTDGKYTCLENVNDIDDAHGRTALHLAARYDRPSCIKILIQAGSKIESNDNDNATPMKLASWKSNCASIQILKSLNSMTDHLDKEHKENIRKCSTGIHSVNVKTNQESITIYKNDTYDLLCEAVNKEIKGCAWKTPYGKTYVIYRGAVYEEKRIKQKGNLKGLCGLLVDRANYNDNGKWQCVLTFQDQRGNSITETRAVDVTVSVNYHHAKTCYTKNDHSCVFPFNYEGKTYKNCIYGEESESWCPYEIKADLTSAKMDWCKEANCSEVTIRDSDSQSHTTTEIDSSLPIIPTNVRLGEPCGICYCPPSYTKGNCATGLDCKYDKLRQDDPGICVQPGVGTTSYVTTSTFSNIATLTSSDKPDKETQKSNHATDEVTLSTVPHIVTLTSNDKPNNKTEKDSRLWIVILVTGWIIATVVAISLFIFFRTKKIYQGNRRTTIKFLSWLSMTGDQNSMRRADNSFL